jgi:hypothetical protein
MYTMLGVLATSTDGVRNNIMVATLSVLKWIFTRQGIFNERDCAMTDILKWLLALAEPSTICYCADYS